VVEAVRRLVVWVPETGLTSCDLLILVDQTAQSIASSDVAEPSVPVIIVVPFTG
jgi:hypothetical protein